MRKDDKGLCPNWNDGTMELWNHGFQSPAHSARLRLGEDNAMSD